MVTIKMRFLTIVMVLLLCLTGAMADDGLLMGLGSHQGASSSPSIDTTTVIGNETATTTATMTLSTSGTNRVVEVCIDPYGGGAASSISDTAGLSWAARISNGNVSCYWAKAASQLSSDIISITVTFGDFIYLAFSVEGANASPFDTNGALPAYAAATSVTYSTTNATDLAVVFFNTGGTATPACPAGFTQITPSAVNSCLAYETLSSPQSGVTVTQSGSNAPNWLYVDAFRN